MLPEVISVAVEGEPRTLGTQLREHLSTPQAVKVTFCVVIAWRRRGETSGGFRHEVYTLKG